MNIVPPNQAYPLPPWARVLFFLAQTVAMTQLQQQFETGREITPQGIAEGDPDPTIWAKVVMTWEDTLSQDTADDQQLAIELVNYTGDLIDITWTEGDYNQIITDIQTYLVTPMLPFIASRLKLASYKIYLRSFADYDAISSDPTKPPPIFVDSGPPVFTLPRNDAATGNSTVPPQVTSTVTEVTPSRAHWGRNYMPTLAGSCYLANGRLGNSVVDAIATAWSDTYDALHSHDFLAVVPTTQSKGAPVRTLQGVTGVRVDDVPDVIRRRRHKYKSYFKHLPLP